MAYMTNEILLSEGINPDTATDDDYEIVSNHHRECEGCELCCSTHYGYTDCDGCEYCCNCNEYRRTDPMNADQYGCNHCLDDDDNPIVREESHDAYWCGYHRCPNTIECPYLSNL